MHGNLGTSVRVALCYCRVGTLLDVQAITPPPRLVGVDKRSWGKAPVEHCVHLRGPSPGGRPFRALGPKGRALPGRALTQLGAGTSDLR